MGLASSLKADRLPDRQEPNRQKELIRVEQVNG